MYRIILPLPRQRSSLFQKSLAREGAGGVGTSQVSLPLNLLGKNPLGVCNTPISLTRNRASCGSHHPRFKPLPARLCRATVSPAGSGPAPQWGASRTDRSESGDRRRTVPTGHLRPQRGRQAPSPRGLSTLCVDWGSQNNKAVTEGAWITPCVLPQLKRIQKKPRSRTSKTAASSRTNQSC